jgi:hypothetical protein
MTGMYMMTEAQHAQIVDALELPSLKTVSMLMQRDNALAMLKAMQPVSPDVYNVWVEGVHIPDDVVKKAVFLYMTRGMEPRKATRDQKIVKPGVYEVAEPVAHFSVMGNPISPHRELIAELRKPMHYLSMAKRNRCANALEGKV